MKRNKKALFGGLLIIIFVSGVLSSCKKMLDIAPEDAVEYSDAYQNVFDADAAVLGVYGKFMSLAGKYVVLNELRADLLDVTENSDKNLRQINDYAVTENNPWADPKPYYEVILNCNDVLENFDTMLADKRLSQEEYNIHYSEVGAIRSWVYLQVGIQYGTVPYITEPLQSIDDLKDESKFPRIPFDQLLTKTLDFTEALPSKERIPSGSSLRLTLDGYNTERMFINKKLLLADLNLWKGNFTRAADYYQDVMNFATEDGQDGEDFYSTYKIAWTSGSLDYGDWDNIFTSSYDERRSNYELIWNIPFDKRFAPKNPFIDLFALQSQGGSYLLKPSAKAIKNWRDETGNDGTPGDANRGPGNSYIPGPQPEVFKMIGNYLESGNQLETFGKWILYRTHQLHLRVAEAALHDNHDSLSYALLNRGIKALFARNAGADKTNFMQSDFPNIGSPYYYDAREGDNPRYRSDWYRNIGVRESVGLTEAKVDSALYFDMSNPGDPNKPFTDKAGFIRAMDKILLHESALELAFEGHSWEDLLRFALRFESEVPGSGKALIHDKIAAKFTVAGKPVPAGVANLANSMDAWFLPFKWE